MEDRRYTLSDFDFDLPEKLIAQYPAEKREASRLFIVNRKTKKYEHSLFKFLPKYLNTGDVLVMNDVRVIPARIFFRRSSGGLTEFVLVRRLNEHRWMSITNRSARLKIGEKLRAVSDESIEIKIIERKNEYFEIESERIFDDAILKKIGTIPLPPYIQRNANENDRERYQTVYAAQGAAAAAPTAGLHFTQQILNELSNKGIEQVKVTLDVSWGTFQPVRTEIISEHIMHSESYEISSESADIINKARNEGRRIIAVGTTSLRVLESSFNGKENVAGKRETDIFIYPPVKVLSATSLITNFHTPKSTLLMLVAAFCGYDLIMDAYREAVNDQYRFFSYGDSMFIE
jgi:S-adenosylmethionine:tRNA ribosyltransferase-isomerase